MSDLSPLDSPTAGGGADARLPAPLLRLRDHAAELLSRAFTNLFLGSDDALLRLAGEAGSSEDQNTYLEYLREIRLQRRAMLEQYLAVVDLAFCRVAGLPVAKAEGSASREGRSEVPAFDSVELALTLENAIAKAQKQSLETLQALIVVINPWLPEPISVRDFPLGPRVLCDAFRQVVEGLQLDGRGKQILGQLFDKAVVQQLERIYPRLQEVLRTSELAAAAATVSAAVAQADTGQQDLADLVLAVSPSDDAQQAPLSGTQLVELLTEAQRHDAQRLQQQSFSGLPTLLQVQQQLQQLSGTSSQIGLDEWRAMTLMQKMVEYIVQDQSLPPPMQRLLSGLHLPLLKVAVLDGAVFSEAGHAARLLLNELANAALGWQQGDDLASEGLYGQVQNCVVYLLLNFTDDITVLQQVLNQFHGARERESRQASILERRTVDAEDGKAAGEQARQLVDAELHPYLAGGQLPTCVTTLLQGAWHKVMLVTLLKYGAASDAWHSVRDAVSTLVWSVTAPMDADGRAKLLQTLPGLLAQLRDGLELIALEADQRSHLLTQLQELHLQRLSESATDTESSGTGKVAADAPSPAVSDEVAASPQQPRVESDESLDSALLERVDRVAKGSWLEVREEGVSPYRCRLAAVISSVDKYIFVDRSGVKVAEKTRHEFALALQNGAFAVLDDGMLFDRALSSVIGDLRRGRGRS